MFSSSTQKKFWTFSMDELTKYRSDANLKYINSVMNDEVSFLSSEEELIIVKHYEKVLREFLQRFMPRGETLPKDVKGTAFHFYKRFFVVSSVMDYHPKEIMITCVFLSCKICEYNVPIDLFVKHIDGNPRLLKNIIIDQELELLYRLNFRLNIHTPYRAIDGFMIDLRNAHLDFTSDGERPTRNPKKIPNARSSLRKPDRLSEHITRFLSSMWFTDVCLMYSPALIGLAAVMHAVSRCKENVDQFVVNTLLNYPPPATLQNIINTVRKIRLVVINVPVYPSNEEISQLENKLAACRNPRNNPSSELFRRTMMEHALESYGNQ